MITVVVMAGSSQRALVDLIRPHVRRAAIMARRLDRG